MSLWRSGIFWAVLQFAAGLGNLVFQGIIKRQLSPDAWAHAATLLTAVLFLGLPAQIAAWAVIHYIAHFKSHNDEARLQGLLAGCQSFLFKATLAGSVLALALAAPFARFFSFRFTEMVAALICVLIGLWSTFATALCQGMSWFKRLALLNFAAVLLRLLWGWVVTGKLPTTEMAVSATTFSLLANLALLIWWKAIFRHKGERISPWNGEFFKFLIVSVGFVAGSWFFMQGDSLAAQRWKFEGMDAYLAAGLFARAIPGTVGPLLNVFFTSRSGRRSDQSARDQKVLLGLYGLGLVCGAGALILLGAPLLKALGRYSEESVRVLPLALAGINQALATWSLASRWLKVPLLYGALGLGYWLVLLAFGSTPDNLLRAMLISSAVAFVALCSVWLMHLRRAPLAAA
jgi:hypothetical protein